MSRFSVESTTLIAAFLLFSLPFLMSGFNAFNNYLFFITFLEKFKNICKTRLQANRTEDIVDHCRYCLNLFKKIQDSLGMQLKIKVTILNRLKCCYFKLVVKSAPFYWLGTSAPFLLNLHLFSIEIKLLNLHFFVYCWLGNCTFFVKSLLLNHLMVKKGADLTTF